MGIYLVTLRPPRENFVEDATPAEEATVDAHFEYLKKLEAEKKLLLAGRTDEGTPTGILLLRAASPEEARRLIELDPAVKAGIFRVELKPFRLAIMSGNG